ncbi:Transglutaminase-like superfamily protein [Ruminococcus flavefaciens]|uniref:Transglutaminase-like superfamily protein n=1 Tax=Ruminococcus flavefaciens TaxID=1265 RepID=A0A1H6I3A9_RUMFL|nr:leucine-rich repeat protein [Ruminococcus flavefaciens]SEH42579.1 Transglutaminase-like superfamily protein [Ruminococcus flavefaciens]
MNKIKHTAITAGALMLTLVPTVGSTGSLSGYAADTPPIYYYGGGNRLVSDEWEATISGFYGEYADLHEYKGNKENVVIPEYFEEMKVRECDIVWSDHPFVKSVTYPDVEFYSYYIADSNVEDLYLPYVTDASEICFEGNEKLKIIGFADSVNTLEFTSDAFKDCTALEKVNMPTEYKRVKVGSYAFSNTNLSEVDYDKPSVIGRSAFANCRSLKSVKLNNSEVDSRAFSDCNALEEISFSGSIALSDLSIYNCPELENIDLTDAEVTSDASFDNCPKLMNINSKPAFDSKTGDFVPEYKEFIFEHFASSDNVGFVDQYVTAQVRKVVAENITDDMTDVEKVRALHDWICRNTEYDPGDETSRKNHNDASVFMNETTVCEGYARILNLLCHDAGIETCFVQNGIHSWNIVKLGCHYFHIDTTWDDIDSSSISYDWFMRSDAEMKKAGGAHASWKICKPTSLHSFQSNVTPVCEYSMGDMNTDGEVGVSDLVKMSRYLLGKESISEDDLPLSDLDLSGNTDVFDMIKLRKVLVNSAE